MAYKSLTGTKRASGGHSAGGTDSTSQTGDVYLAWDTSKVTSFNTLKDVLNAMLLDIQGGKLT